MNSLIKILPLILLLSLPIKSMSQSDCNPYLLLTEGKKWTTANYNAKDKYQGKQSYEVLSVKEEDGTLNATVKIISYDKKDKVVLEDEVEFSCTDGVVEMDMSKYIPEETLNSFQEMDMEVEMDPVKIPNELKVGDYLPDGGINMTISGPMKMTMSIKIQDRKVMAKEKINVPAGEFEAFKVNSIIKFDAMVSRESKSIEWIAEKVGVVRTEQYDKRGNLAAYSVLTEFN